MKRNMYKAIFLDIDDTIFNFERCSQNALRHTCLALEVPYNQQAYMEFRRIDDTLWKEQKSGHISVEDVLRIRAERFMAFLGCPSLSLVYREHFAECLSEEVDLEPFAQESIKKLSSFVKLYAASNGSLTMQEARLKKVGLLSCFTELYVSDDIGFEKPDIRFFAEALKRSGWQKEDALMVGDSLSSDVEGANRFGMDCCWYNPKRKNVPSGYKLSGEIWNLQQLPELVRRK